MASVRPPAVAGSFYPASPDALASTVDALLAAVPRDSRRPKAIVVPHAGYIYSGPIAASPFARVPADIERVVLIGPAHRVYVDGLAWPGVSHLRTPLGDLEVDVAAIERLPELEANPVAHAREHALEVELPFLQKVAPRAKLVPLVASRARPEAVGAVLAALWGGSETLIAISSDLSHYLSYAAGRARDRATATRIVDRDPTLAGDDACGATAVNGLSWLARERGLAVELIDLRSSGDTAGPRDEVVGYGAFAYYEAA
jgi:AmmeMemoRadiSam system protein B